MAEELKKLLREYEGGRVSRREFMRQAVIMTGSLAAANGLIGGLLPPHSYAAQVAANDPDVLTHNVNYEGKPGRLAGLSGSADESRTISRPNRDPSEPRAGR